MSTPDLAVIQPFFLNILPPAEFEVGFMRLQNKLAMRK